MSAKVLFVDDEQGILEGLGRALRKEPYEILTASSAEAALRILADEEVDVVVSDENMPGMSGSELLREVRIKYPSTIRIMLTGCASVASAMNAIYDGWVYQYLHKPVKASDLASAIHYSILTRSLLKEGEGPHVLMSGQEQVDLLNRLADSDQSEEGGSADEPGPDATSTDVARAINEIYIALEDAKGLKSVSSLLSLVRNTLDRVEREIPSGT